MYEKGIGVLTDDKKAIKWYLKAAKQGVSDAQYNLGLMYDNGEGVLKDLSKAKYWIKKAYENPDVNAYISELAEKRLKQLELWKY
jgi:TPR repeat protein